MYLAASSGERITRRFSAFLSSADLVKLKLPVMTALAVLRIGDVLVVVLPCPVLADGKKYPPKAVVGIAAKLATGQSLHPSDFSGGEGGGQANTILRQLGFDVVAKERTRAFILTWNMDEIVAGGFSKLVRLTGIQCGEGSQDVFLRDAFGNAHVIGAFYTSSSTK